MTNQLYIAPDAWDVLLMYMKNSDLGHYQKAIDQSIIITKSLIMTTDFDDKLIYLLCIMQTPV